MRRKSSMKNHVEQEYQSLSELLNGKNISLSDVEAIHKNLLMQYEEIAHEIVDSVDRNDYVMVSLLITRRKKFQSAIEEIQSALNEDSLCAPETWRDRVSNVLRICAEMTEDKGEDVLQIVSDGVEGLNQSAHSLSAKTLDVVSKTCSISNKLGHKAGRFLINQTSTGLSKLADAFKSKS
jgi:hypothetical protein